MKLIESDVTANQIQLHVYRTHTNKPPLLFAHGRSDNGLCFWPVAQQFAAEFEIILYDARGHGQSEKPESSTGLMDRVQDLAGLIEALGLQKPKLVGHSLGALTVALVAGTYPNLPDCIVLEDPPPVEMMASKSEEALAHHKESKELIETIQGKSIPELVALNRHDSPTWPEAEREPWAQAKLQYQLKPFGEDYIDAAKGREIISQITCPTLMLTADLDLGAITSPQAADELVARLPQARHVHIPGAGHNIRREQPEAYLSALRDFLKAFS